MKLIYSTPGFHQYIAYHDKNWTVEVWLRLKEDKNQILIMKHAGGTYHIQQDSKGEIHCAIPLPKVIREHVNLGINFILRKHLTPPTRE